MVGPTIYKSSTNQNKLNILNLAFSIYVMAHGNSNPLNFYTWFNLSDDCTNFNCYITDIYSILITLNSDWNITKHNNQILEENLKSGDV